MANAGRRRISHGQSKNIGAALDRDAEPGRNWEQGRASSRPISSAQKVVQYQIGKQRSRAQMAPRSLINDPKTREKRLKLLVKRLSAKKNVQNRDIKLVLTPAQWEACNTAFTEVEAAVIPCPVELDDYFKLVRAADFQHIKNSTVAEGCYEHAQERLDEILSSCSAQQRSAMEHWLDRPVEYDPETGKISIGLDPSSVPRKRGSKSQHARAVASNVQTVWGQMRQIKLGHLDMALNSLRKPKQANGLSKKEIAKLDALRKLVRR